MSQEAFAVGGRAKENIHLTLGRKHDSHLLDLVATWSGAIELQLLLFVPGKRAPFAEQVGVSPLRITCQLPDTIPNKPFRIQIKNTGQMPLEGILSVASPSSVDLQVTSPQARSRNRPPAVPLVLYLAERYVEGVTPMSDLDRAVKDALDPNPRNKLALREALGRWHATPATRRTLAFGTEFANLTKESAIPQERLLQQFRIGIDRALPSLRPGLRSTQYQGVVPLERLSIPEHMSAPAVGMPQREAAVHSAPMEPTYRINFAGLYCRYETTSDGWLTDSDEPYVVFSVTDGWKTWTRRSDIYADVDGGEARAPSPALFTLFGETGAEVARDIGLISVVFEHDEGDPDYYRDEVHALVEIARLAAAAGGIPVPEAIGNIIEDIAVWALGTDDETIGSAAVVLDKGVFFGAALTDPIFFKGLAYNLCSGAHSGDGAEYYTTYNLIFDPPIHVPKWSNWSSVAGIIEGDPAATSWGPSRLDIIALGENGDIWHRCHDDASGWYPSTSGWGSLGKPGRNASSPAVVSWWANRLDILVSVLPGEQAIAPTVLHKCYDGASGWYPSLTSWGSLGGVGLGRPIAVSWGPSRLDLFVRIIADGRILHKYYRGAEGWYPSISEWSDLGGQAASDPAAVSWAPNRLDVIVLGKNGQILHKCFDGTHGWYPSLTEWSSLGGSFSGRPAIVSWGRDRLDIFVRGNEGSIWHKCYCGPDGWYPSLTEWTSLGGYFPGDPAVVAWGPDRLDIFVRGNDGAVWHKCFNGSDGWYPSLTDWASLGGNIESDPVVVSRSAGRLDLLARSSDGRLCYRSYF